MQASNTNRGFIWGVYSVWLRHARVYQKTWFVNCLAPLSEPILYLFAFGYGLGPLVKELNYQGKEIDYLTFIAPGMIAVAVMFQAYFEGAYGAYVRLHFQKIWQTFLTAPLTFTEIFFGDLLWAVTRGCIAGFATAIVAYCFSLIPLSSMVINAPIIILGSIIFRCSRNTIGWNCKNHRPVEFTDILSHHTDVRAVRHVFSPRNTPLLASHLRGASSARRNSRFTPNPARCFGELAILADTSACVGSSCNRTGVEVNAVEGI